MLSKAETGKEREKPIDDMIRRIMEMNVEVTSDDKFVCGSCKEEERIESSIKQGFGLENGDDEDGR